MAFVRTTFQLEHPVVVFHSPLLSLFDGFRLRDFLFDYSTNISFPCVF
jgi:hypothetical protein